MTSRPACRICLPLSSYMLPNNSDGTTSCQMESWRRFQVRWCSIGSCLAEENLLDDLMTWNNACLVMEPPLRQNRWVVTFGNRQIFPRIGVKYYKNVNDKHPLYSFDLINLQWSRSAASLIPHQFCFPNSGPLNEFQKLNEIAPPKNKEYPLKIDGWSRSKVPFKKMEPFQGDTC